jgi:hypothetical protein
MPATLPASIVAALGLAARAPSAHNTQPWQVVVEAGRLRVRADPTRWLRHGDPLKRDLRLSLGAFTEALRIALGGEGQGYALAGPDGDDFAALVPEGTPAKSDQLSLSLLRRRQTSRLVYSPRVPEPERLASLEQAARTAGLDLHLVPRGTPERTTLDQLCWAAAREAWLDARAVAELGAWVRVDPDGIRRPPDGLSTHCLGLGPAQTAAMLALLRPGLWRAAGAVYAAPFLAAALARQEAAPVQAAPFLAVLVAPRDAGGAGGGLLREWLAATAQGLALAPMSAVIDRRGWELGRQLGVAPDRLALVARVGRSVPPPLSGRRAVSDFAATGTGLA